MSPRHHFSTEMPQSIYDEEDHYDDGHDGVPMRTLTARSDLRARFLCRLAKLTATHVSMEEVGDTTTIYVSRTYGSHQAKIEDDVELQQFHENLKGLLEIISQHRTGNVFEQAKGELKDLILMFTYTNIDHIVEGVKRTFADNHGIFEEFVTRMFGIEEGPGSKLDTDLGALVIQLHQNVSYYDSSLRQLNGLIDLTWSIANRIDHLQDRLKYLLRRGKFANELYSLISTLGSPKRAHDTFVRTAQTSHSFQKVTIKATHNPNSPKRVHFGNSQPRESPIAAATPLKPAVKSTATHERQNKTKRSTRPFSSSYFPPQHFNTVPSKTPSPQPHPQPQQQKLAEIASASSPAESPTLSPQQEFINTILPYLSPDDRATGLARLQPLAKQDTARLLGSVLRGNLVPKQTTAWYEFGFVATRTEDEERLLAGLYSVILRSAPDKPAIFHDLTRAVESSTLTKLFDSKEYSNFREISPRLEQFLATPPAHRSSVWKLKHFIHDESNTQPPPVLRRDYGFKYCRLREEVTRIKGVYAKMLADIDAKDIHDACRHGRLVELAVQRGVHVEAKDRRLMQNDFPAQYVGFDNEVGLDLYSGSFYKRRL